MKTSLLALLLLALPAGAADVLIEQAWARATLPGQPVGGAYLTLRASAPARLLKVESPAAGMVEIHEMKLQDGVMKMRPLAGIDLPAGQTVELKPGGLHLMLMDLQGPLLAGKTVPLQLHIEQGSKTRIYPVNAEVRSVGGH